MKPVARTPKSCEFCGRSFRRMACELTRGRGRFCSRKCLYASRSNGVEIACSKCGTPCRRKRSEVAENIYCSQACYKASRSAILKGYKEIGSEHEHRIVAAVKLGRSLTSSDIVHHEDEVKLNNSPDNLLVTDRPMHAKIHFSGIKQSRDQVRKRVESRRLTLERKHG